MIRCPTARFDISALNSTWTPPVSDLASGAEHSTAVLFEMQVMRVLLTDWDQAEPEFIALQNLANSEC